MGNTNALYEGVEGIFTGFGAGIVVSAILQTVSGGLTTMPAIVTAPFTVVLTFIGLGLGFMGGHKKDVVAQKAEDAALLATGTVTH